MRTAVQRRDARPGGRSHREVYEHRGDRGGHVDAHKGPGRRVPPPEAGYRYFFVLLDVATRTVQLALVHPQRTPATLTKLLPSLPATLDAAALGAVRGLRLPE